MPSIEQELWNIFTHYTMHCNPRDPSKLNSIGLAKFCKDIMVLDQSMTECPILSAEVHLLFAAEVKKNQMQAKQHQEGKDKLSYEEFLSCLTQLALRCYPSFSTPEEATQQLLMDNVFPLALRRTPTNISGIVNNPQIEEVLNSFQDPLKELFQYFATSTEKRAKATTMIKTTSKYSMSFDEHKEDIDYREKHLKSKNLMLLKMQYSDFVRFAQDFGLLVTLGLGNLDIADIFLTVTAISDFSPELGRFDFKNFGEALVRCAMTAYSQYTHVSPSDKLKAMFLSIWRHIQSNMQQQLVTYSGVGGSFYQGFDGGFVRGAQMFNERFITCWSKDGYMDYLEGKVSKDANIVAGQGTNVITNLLSQSSLSSSLNISSPRSPASKGPRGSTSASPKSPKKATSSSYSQARFSTAKSTKRIQISSPDSKPVPADAQTFTSSGISFVIDDGDDLGDSRIKASELRALLRTRPDIADTLYGFIKELGLEDK